MQHDGAVGLFTPEYRIVRFNANFRNVFKTSEDFARFSDVRKSLSHLPGLVGQLLESVISCKAISTEIPPDKTISFPGGKLIVRPWSAFRRWPLLYAMEFRPNEGSNQDSQAQLWTSFIAEQGHTVKNNIVALRNFTDAILTRLNESPTDTPQEVFNDLKSLKRNIGFTISTARKLVDFSQYQPPNFKPSNVSIVLNEIVEEYRRQFSGGPILEYQLAENAVRAYTDIHHLKQILRILLQNSARAAGDSGQIQLSVQQISNPSMSGNLWEAEIWDNGKGIAQDVIDQVFDANYSTAPDGNGMGLAYVKMIVENNLGSIKVESKENHFTRF
ncbi:MAG: HAMP domain-containing sensor histidine kinase, partial [Calditrichota bacterium]